MQINQLLVLAAASVAFSAQACGGQVASDPRHASGGSGMGGSTPGVGGSDALPDSGGAAATTGGTAAGGAATATGGTDRCLGYTFCRRPAPEVLNFTIDTSSVMSTKALSTEGRTKWEVTRELLHVAFAALPVAWAVGATLFNSETTHMVPIEPVTLEQRARLDDALDQVVPQGGMPLSWGWTLGMNQLLDFQVTEEPYSYVGKFNVLVVDGVPTVDRDGVTPGTGMNGTISQEEYESTIQAVAEQTLNTGIRTFVFGVPGSDDPQGAPYDPLYQLSLVADAGGTAVPQAGPTPGTVEPCYDSTNQRESSCLVSRGTYCHLDLMTDPDISGSLKSALTPISGSCPCSFQLSQLGDGTPLDADRIRLVYTSTGGVPSELQRSLDDCSTGDWTLSEPMLDFADLCPGMCDTWFRWGPGGCMEVVTGLEPGTSCAYHGGCV